MNRHGDPNCGPTPPHLTHYGGSLTRCRQICLHREGGGIHWGVEAFIGTCKSEPIEATFAAGAWKHFRRSPSLDPRRNHTRGAGKFACTGKAGGIWAENDCLVEGLFPRVGWLRRDYSSLGGRRFLPRCPVAILHLPWDRSNPDGRWRVQPGRHENFHHIR